MKEKSRTQLPSNLKKKRALHPEEEELWHRVRKTVSPIDAKRQDLMHWLDAQEADNPDTGINPLQKIALPAGDKPAPKIPSRLFPVRSYSPPVSLPSPQGQSGTIDDKTARKLSRGKLSIDARIDLHGMTQTQAHAVLKNFLFDCFYQNSRMVLVITGKGRLQEGVLKQAVPHWLREPQIAQFVSAFRTANITHGGEGALYVRLRKRDKVNSDKVIRDKLR